MIEVADLTPLESNVYREVARTLKIRRKAARLGRRSRSTINVDRIAQKHNAVRADVDLLAGMLILGAGLELPSQWHESMMKVIEQFRAMRGENAHG